MNARFFRKLLTIVLLLSLQTGYGQYILNGSAQKVSCNCYTLTDERINQSGSVWNSNKIDLSQSFDFWFTVFLGCRDAVGADGIVFILQPVSTSVGTTGAGMGFEGVSPSVGIALDTWQNLNQNDPDFDHISMQLNGSINHAGDLAGPVAASIASNNIEDCQWHKLRIKWNAVTKTLTAYFDNVLRLEKTIDLVSTVFNNDPAVYWGFSGGTGASVNLQQFCTALNPIVSTSTAVNSVCERAPLQFLDASESFATITNYNWSFGDGSFSTEKEPQHTYATSGTYPVTLQIRGQDGCEKDSTFTVTVGSEPKGNLTVMDTCNGFPPRMALTENNTAVSYQWALNGSVFSSEKVPQLPSPPAGNQTLSVIMTSDFACGAPVTISDNFLIKPAPEVWAQVEDGCRGETLFFRGTQTDNATTIDRWHWNFGDGVIETGQNPSHAYTSAGQFEVSLWAAGTNGCLSQAHVLPVKVGDAFAFAGRDTAVIHGLPFQLQGSGPGSFSWTPSTELSDPTIANPVATLQRDQQYILTTVSPEGCTATDTVMIKTFVGPAVYVPSAFTPNGDGKNETLRPVYVGIKELKQFAIFNRWGQRIFSTHEMGRGWQGKDGLPGTYVWVVEAVDASGKSIVKKGTVILIR
ncbi:PKD domain-containing protein [Flavisolibacter sp. BT320]|nr:PKD domain-containing protein [Flavisolibacter longurius]